MAKRDFLSDIKNMKGKLTVMMTKLWKYGDYELLQVIHK